MMLRLTERAAVASSRKAFPSSPLAALPILRSLSRPPFGQGISPELGGSGTPFAPEPVETGRTGSRRGAVSLEKGPALRRGQEGPGPSENTGECDVRGFSVGFSRFEYPLPERRRRHPDGSEAKASEDYRRVRGCRPERPPARLYCFATAELNTRGEFQHLARPARALRSSSL